MTWTAAFIPKTASCSQSTCRARIGKKASANSFSIVLRPPERQPASPGIRAINQRPWKRRSRHGHRHAAIPRQASLAGWRVVTPGYFAAVGLPLVRGRLFDENDKPVWIPKDVLPYPRRVIISDRLAKQIFPNEDPIGKQVILWKGQSGVPAQVVGVVGDSRERGLAENPTLTVYLPYGTNALTTEFVVHTRGNPLALVPTIRSLVAALDPNLPISDVRSFEQVVNRSVAPQRLNAILLSIFSVLAWPSPPPASTAFSPTPSRAVPRNRSPRCSRRHAFQHSRP